MFFVTNVISKKPHISHMSNFFQKHNVKHIYKGAPYRRSYDGIADSYKNKNVCLTLNYTEHFLTLLLTVTGCISISAFASLFDIPIDIL